MSHFNVVFSRGRLTCRGPVTTNPILYLDLTYETIGTMLSMFSMPYACSRLFGPWQQQDLVTGEERGSEVQCRICERRIVQWNVYFIAKRVSPPQALGQGEHSSEQWLGWDSNLTTWAKLLSTFVIWRSRAPYLAALSRKSCYRCHPLRGNLTLREHSFIIRNKERPDEIIFGINNS